MSLPALAPNALEGLEGWTAPEAVARLAAVAAALPSCADLGVLEGLARALPNTVATLAPEVCAALTGVAAALVPHGPVIPRDLAQLEPRLRIEWRRVELAAGLTAELDALDDTELLWVVRGWSMSAMLDPRALMDRLLGARDPRLREALLAGLLPLVVALAITPTEALAVVLALAQDRDPSIRAGALGLLGEGSFRSLAPAAERERAAVIVGALADPSAEVARAAIASAAALGRRDWLLERVLDEEDEGSARSEALEALGTLAHEEDLDLVLALAEEEPLRFAAPARAVLLAAHRHGAFVRARHLDAILAQFDGHPLWTGEELVRVTYIVRAELVDRLATLEPDDPRWVRRAWILSASVGTRAHLVLREQLEQVRELAVAQALVEAAGHSPEYEGEAPLLAWLDSLPEVVIPVLRVKGGAAAEARLRAWVLDLRREDALRRLAMSVLWALCRDRVALLRELSTRLGPHDSGLLDERYTTHRDPEIARLVIEAPWPDEPRHAIDPNRRLAIACESGDIERRPAIEGLFREVFRGYVRRALAGDFMVKRVALPELEQQLFRYGRHLVKAGRGVRRFLEPGPETGRDLVLQIAVDWLNERPTSAVCVALLELIGRHTPGAATLRFVEPLWRHRDREVRRAAIETILAAGEEARGLELSICRLAEHEEPRIMAQALAAVAALGAQWAEPMVLAALRRAEMAVKKEAAHALAQVGSARAVAPLVEWIAHHDNRGFREELLAALEHAAGPSLVAVLVDALDRETEPRRIELLGEALSGRLTLAAALRLARSPGPRERA